MLSCELSCEISFLGTSHLSFFIVCTFVGDEEVKKKREAPSSINTGINGYRDAISLSSS